jgi:hypothetical protein
MKDWSSRFRLPDATHGPAIDGDHSSISAIDSTDDSGQDDHDDV